MSYPLPPQGKDIFVVNGTFGYFNEPLAPLPPEPLNCDVCSTMLVPDSPGLGGYIDYHCAACGSVYENDEGLILKLSTEQMRVLRIYAAVRRFFKRFIA